MAGLLKQAADALAPIFRPAGATINGINTGDFASPQQPIRPIMPPGVGIRQWDLTPGLNLQFSPRGDTAVNFAQLRNVANSFDICRLMIETRKDQIINRPWSIRVKAIEGETNKQRIQRGANNANVKRATDLLKRPDGVRPFPLWIRMWLDQLLVFDAPCIYPARNVLGDVMGLRIISGATITPLVDEQGFIPRPPNPAYQQIILGLPSSNLLAVREQAEFTADQLIYSPRNPRCDSRWGFGPVEQIINTLQIAANWQQSVKLGFTSGNVPEGLMPMPDSWTMQQIKDFQNWFDGLLAGNLAKKRRMIAVPDSKRPAQFSKEKILIDPTINEYLIRVVAFAFSVTPQNLIKQINRATAKESSDVAQIEGLEPYLKHIETTINLDMLEGVFGITDVEFAYEDEREMDPVKQAQADDIALKNASKTVNQVCMARGDDPFPDPAFDVPHVYTPTGAIPFGQTSSPAAPGAEGEGNENPPEPNAAKKVRKAHRHEIRGGAMTPTSRYAAGRFAKVATAGLKKLGKVAAKLGATEYAKVIKVRKADEEPPNPTPEEIDRVLAAIELDWATFGADVTPALRDAALSGVQQGTEQVYTAARGAGTDYVAAAKSHALAYAEQRGAEMVGMRRTEDGSFVENPDARWAIDEPTRNGLRSKIEQAFTDRWSPAKLADEIENAYDFSEERAGVIAKSEITKAQAQGNLASWMKSGVVLKVQWQTSADHDHEDECDDYEDEGEVDPGHEFAPGVMAPDAHPNCECALVITKVKE